MQRDTTTSDPAGYLRGALRPIIVVSHPGVTNLAGFGVLMNCVDSPGIIGYANVANGYLVPLSTQALATLSEQREITGDGPLMFPGVRSGRPMRDAARGWRSSNSSLFRCQ